MDAQYLITNGENLVGHATRLVHGRLHEHHPTNPRWGSFHDGNMSGGSLPVQTLKLARISQPVEHGKDADQMAFDVHPVPRPDPEGPTHGIEMGFFWVVPARMSDESLHEALRRRDAAQGQELMCEALGVDRAYKARVITKLGGWQQLEEGKRCGEYGSFCSWFCSPGSP